MKDSDIEDSAQLFVQEIRVDSAGQCLKRIRTAPQGRAHRIRKRSNHVTIMLNTKDNHSKYNKLNGTKNKSNRK